MQPQRFLDRHIRIEQFSDEMLVVCSHCGGCARVFPVPGATHYLPQFISRRILCATCGYTKDIPVQGYGCPDGLDWYFHLPLWLCVRGAGGKIWAFNWRHLAWLENYVQATQRRQWRHPQYGWSNQSAANRLPLWIKQGKNRDDVLRAIAKLKRQRTRSA